MPKETKTPNSLHSKKDVNKPIEKKCEKCGKDCGNDPIHTCYIPSTSTDTERDKKLEGNWCDFCGKKHAGRCEKVPPSFLEERLKAFDKISGEDRFGLMSADIAKDFLTETIKLGDERALQRQTASYKHVGKDELYCDFIECNNCENSNIPSGSKYCSNCGFILSPLTNDKKV